MSAQQGVKFDGEKIQMDLLSARWLFGVGEVLTYGAKKYAAHNWRKGISRARLLAATLRHVFAYLRGEDCDPETGLLHLHHASCCLMFAAELHYTRPDLDDRYKEIVEAKKPLAAFPCHKCGGFHGDKENLFCPICTERNLAKEIRGGFLIEPEPITEKDHMPDSMKLPPAMFYKCGRCTGQAKWQELADSGEMFYLCEVHHRILLEERMPLEGDPNA